MGVALVTIVVPDYDAGIAFFVGALGFDLVTDEDQGSGKRWVTVRPPDDPNGTALLLARAADATQRASIGNQTGGRVGFFLETLDFETSYDRMIRAGVQFEEAPRSEPYGQVAVFRDPFGNRWDLLQRR